MEEKLYYNELFLIYGELLTEKEKDTFKDYYFEDLSLSEIADNNSISRAAVQKTIKNVLDKLDYYERILSVSKKNNDLKEILKLNDVNEIKKQIENVLED